MFLFQITLDGSKEIHNRLRPHKVNNNSFEKIVDNLSGITEFVKKYYRIVLRVNITKDLVKNIDGFIEDLQYIRKNKKILLIVKRWEIMAVMESKTYIVKWFQI